MPATPAPVHTSYLERNLAAINDLDAPLRDTLRQTAPRHDMQFATTPQGVETASLGGRALCSRHRPIEEARRLADRVDLVEHAVVVVFGFGMGYHVQQLAERLKRTGLMIVFEPDVALLRSVLERVDHSHWMRQTNLLWMTDPNDRAGLATKLSGAESIVAQGVTFLEHPASQHRLAPHVGPFTELLRKHVTAAKTTLVTTLVRSVDTVRNMLGNIDHYVGGAGIADLRNLTAGYPAVVVSAGPSLQRNIQLLAEPGVRERCVIIAVQTTLKPLLNAGVAPHYVTALDYHAISKRFYEGIDAAQVRDTTLVAEPKASPVILDSFPGGVRCCAAKFLDQLLGEHARDMGALPAGATVAHLAVYLAHYLGCDPIVTIGQDLGFPDGLYYTPGTAIHDVWAPELNPFNTVEMMQWQRIARMSRHLHEAEDIHGKTIYTDTQMLTYLQQFERDFAQYQREGRTIIDASEGGVAKQHARVRPLRDTLDEFATRPLPNLPDAPMTRDQQRMQKARTRVESVRKQIVHLVETSKSTGRLLNKMIDDQRDQNKMAAHFQKIDRLRKQVDDRFEAFEILNYLNQLGVYKRLKADRRLEVQTDLDPIEHQRGQLDRDLVNVQWTRDAGQEMVRLLSASERLLNGEKIDMPRRTGRDLVPDDDDLPRVDHPRVAAMVPVDPKRNALGVARSLDAPFGDATVIQTTLERLDTCHQLESIILFAPRDCDIEAMIDRRRIARPIEIHWCDGSPFQAAQPAIAAARKWAMNGWRGGVAGIGAFDEALCARPMHEAMQARGLTAAVIVAPDWPLVDVSDDQGVAAIIHRYLEFPSKHNIVFTQAPPGLGACLLSDSLLRDIASETRMSTIGAALIYQPQAPNPDPIANESNVQIDHRVRQSLIRATYDTQYQREVLDGILEQFDQPRSVDSITLVDAIEKQVEHKTRSLPQHVIVELCTDRQARGEFIIQSRFDDIHRPVMSLETMQRICDSLRDGDDIVMTFAGVGDPLAHPQFDAFIECAKAAGVQGVHVQTELLADRSVLERLLACDVDIVSIELHADTPTTYEKMMGADRFQQVLRNIEFLANHRRRLTLPDSTRGYGLPWIVPRMRRCATTYEEVRRFYDRWQHILGTVLLEGVPPFEPDDAHPPDALQAEHKPEKVARRDLRQRLVVFSDGTVPISELDLHGEQVVGNVNETSLAELWPALLSRRNVMCFSNAQQSPSMYSARTFWP